MLNTNLLYSIGVNQSKISKIQKDIVILDTSVLLSDYNCLYNFPKSEIVLPLTVIEELDTHKQRLDDIGHAARSCSRLLEKLRIANGGDLNKPIEIGENSSIRVELNGLQIALIREKGLNIEKNDNRIIAAALGLKNVEGNNVMLYSQDVNMRLKASALGINSFEYTPFGRSESDDQIEVIEADSEYIDQLYQKRGQDNLYGIPLNGVAVLKSGKQSVLVRNTIDGVRKIKDSNPWGLTSRSKEQSMAIDLLMDPSLPIVSLDGDAGTGKTILALAAGLEQVFEPDSIRYDRLMILRPVVSVGRQDIGFLPGDIEDKLGPWFEAVVDTMVALGSRTTHLEAKKNLEMWVQQDKLTMESVTFLRGRSLQKTYIIVDEAQNLESLVLKTVLTRVGAGSKIVLLGDTTQIDNPYLSRDSNAIAVLKHKFFGEELYGHVRLSKGERSEVATLASKIL